MAVESVGVGLMAVVGVCVMVPLLVGVVSTLDSAASASKAGEAEASAPGSGGGVLSVLLATLRQLNRGLSDKVVLLLTAAMPVCAIWMHWSRMVIHTTWAGVLLLHALPSVWINSGMLYHLYMAATTDPGDVTHTVMAGLTPRLTAPRPPANCRGGDAAAAAVAAAPARPPARLRPTHATHAEPDPEPEPEKAAPARHCAKCDAGMPALTHHCRRCRRCTAELDHHCPFTGGCVGRGNYRFFLGFVGWSWAATVYAVWLTTNPGYLCRLDEYALGFTCGCEGVTQLQQISAGSLLVMSLLLVLTITLLARGQTFRGFLAGKPPALAVHGGGRVDNAERRLGPRRQWWRLAVPGALR